MRSDRPAHAHRVSSTSTRAEAEAASMTCNRTANDRNRQSDGPCLRRLLWTIYRPHLQDRLPMKRYSGLFAACTAALLATAGIAMAQDASTDTAFGIGGHALVDWDPPTGTATDTARAMAVQPDGRIVLGGHVVVVPSGGAGGYFGCALTRLLADGQIDTGFGDNGRVVVNFPAPVPPVNSGVVNGCIGQSVAIDAQGRILIAAWQNIAYWDGPPPGGQYQQLPQHIAVARFTAAGIADTSFAADGRMHFHFQSEGMLGIQSDTPQLLALPDGKLFVITTVQPQVNDYENTQVGTARLNANGTLDSTYFGNGKRILASDTGRPWTANHAILDRESRILITGSYMGADSQPRMWLGRLAANGLTDGSFGIFGRWSVSLQLPAGASAAVSYAVGLDSRNRILLAGASLHGGQGTDVHMALVRRTAANAFDNTFGTNGQVVIPFRYAALDVFSEAVAIVEDASDNLVVSGRISRPLAGGYEYLFATARVNSVGALDTSYWSGGRRVVETGFLSPGPRQDIAARGALAIMPSGRILIAGAVRRGFFGPQPNDDFAVLALRGAPATDLIFRNGFE